MSGSGLLPPRMRVIAASTISIFSCVESSPRGGISGSGGASSSTGIVRSCCPIWSSLGDSLITKSARIAGGISRITKGE
ncbi:MAG: hypothetical protein LAT68_14715 [Cyclobacteriaceae bacterium]|nr:hypothetical protein [Cyclobacteriaceae bacterium]